MKVQQFFIDMERVEVLRATFHFSLIEIFGQLGDVGLSIKGGPFLVCLFGLELVLFY